MEIPTLSLTGYRNSQQFHKQGMKILTFCLRPSTPPPGCKVTDKVSQLAGDENENVFSTETRSTYCAINCTKAKRWFRHVSLDSVQEFLSLGSLWVFHSNVDESAEQVGVRGHDVRDLEVHGEEGELAAQHVLVSGHGKELLHRLDIAQQNDH